MKANIGQTYMDQEDNTFVTTNNNADKGNKTNIGKANKQKKNKQKKNEVMEQKDKFADFTQNLEKDF